MLPSGCNYLKRVLSQHLTSNFDCLHKVHFSKILFKKKNWQFYRSAIMKKIITLIACTRNRFDFWNSCKRLQNFVNVEALVVQQIGYGQADVWLVGQWATDRRWTGRCGVSWWRDKRWAGRCGDRWATDRRWKGICNLAVQQIGDGQADVG